MKMRCIAALLLAMIGVCHAQRAQSARYKLIYSPPSLSVPEADPIMFFEVSPGIFCVVGARETNTFGYSIFTVTSTGTVKLIYSFPVSTDAFTLVQGFNGLLYGPGFAALSNYNFYFSLSPSGANLQEFSFPGQWGSAGQTIATPGGLFDIVAALSSRGTQRTFGFASVSNTGAITVLHQFSGTDGAPTGANLAIASDDNLYGVGNDQWGGVSPGFIFRFTPSGDYSRLLNFPSFPTNGSLPLIAASDGNLYGTFGAGGPSNSGLLYRATLAGRLQTVAAFPADMALPETLMEAADGNIYGSTNTNAIFRYDLTSHKFTNAYQLAINGSQARCPCPLVQGMDGKLYGVSSFGGPYPGVGTVFSLDLGLPRPKPTVSALYPKTGRVGTRVLLWGGYLLAASSVTFNGVLATELTVTSGQSVWVTVPPAATTGPVTIKTPNGSFTTTSDFTVQ